MPVINQEDNRTLQNIFAAELTNPVLLRVFTQAKSRIEVPSLAQLQQECRYCQETRMIAEEIGALSGKIHVEVLDFQADAERARQMQIDKIPALAVLGDTDYGIRFYGIPSGYEFSVLIEDIVRVSHRDSGLAQETRAELAKLQKDVDIQVFVTPA